MTYHAGEEIQQGDHVLYHGESGRVEFIANADDPATAWYVTQFGGGCMIATPGFGHVFLSHPEAEQDLEFIARVS